LAPVPTDFFPESDELDVLLVDELDEEAPPEAVEPDDLPSLELELDSDLAVESDLSLEPLPLPSDLAELSAPSPLLLPAGTFPFRLSVR